MFDVFTLKKGVSTHLCNASCIYSKPKPCFHPTVIDLAIIHRANEIAQTSRGHCSTATICRLCQALGLRNINFFILK